MLSLNVNLKNEQHLRKSLAHIADNVSNIEEPMDEILAALLNNTRKRFLNQESPDGGKWPTSQAAKYRKVTGKDGGTLYDTGALFRSIKGYTEGPGERSIAVSPQATNKSGMPVKKYAEKHQKGLDGMPQRKFLGLSQDDTNTALNILRDHLERAI